MGRSPACVKGPCSTTPFLFPSPSFPPSFPSPPPLLSFPSLPPNPVTSHCAALLASASPLLDIQWRMSMRMELTSAVIVKCGLMDPRSGRITLLAGSIERIFLNVSAPRAAAHALGRLRWKLTALVRIRSHETLALRRDAKLPSAGRHGSSSPFPLLLLSAPLLTCSQRLEPGSSAHFWHTGPPRCPAPWQGPGVAEAGAAPDGINANAVGRTGQGPGGAAISVGDGLARGVDLSAAGSRAPAFVVVAQRGSSCSTCPRICAH